MKLWVNWRTKITHLSRDCHQLGRVPDEVEWFEVQEGSAVELVDTPRRYCGFCVARYLIAGDLVGVEPVPEFRDDAERIIRGLR